MKLSRRTWMVIAAVIAVAGIAVSNLPFMGPSGKVSGAGSAVASKISFSVGATAAIAFLVLCVLAVRAGRRARRSVTATTS